MILNDAINIHSFSASQNAIERLSALIESFNIQNSEHVLLLLQYLQEGQVIRSLDRNFARYIHQAFIDTHPSETKVSGSVLLLAALLSKHVGNGHVCLNIEMFIKHPERLLSSRDIRLSENSLYTYADFNQLIKCVHISLNALNTQQLTDALLQSNVASDEAQKTQLNTPLKLKNNRCYLERLFHYENIIVSSIQARLPCLEQFADENSAHTQALKDILSKLFATNNSENAAKSLSQKLACALAARSQFSVITGGPGTGKTTTVLKLLAALQALAGKFASPSAAQTHQKYRIGLAAPTGKAAARLTESISAAAQSLPYTDLPGNVSIEDIPTKVTTIDVLLGRGYNTRKFKFNKSNKLALDILVVDEASMIDVDLMAALMSALEHNARLFLLGDKDQLASVDAGAVLGDLAKGAGQANYSVDTVKWLSAVMQVEPRNLQGLLATNKDESIHGLSALHQNIALLNHSFRFDAQSGIKRLSDEVNRGNAKNEVFTAFKNGELADSIWLHEALELSFSKDNQAIHSQRFKQHLKTGSAERFNQQGALDPKSAATGYESYFKLLNQCDLIENANIQSLQNNAHAIKILHAFDKFRVLTAIKSGPWGVESINKAVEYALDLIPDNNSPSAWYHGRPVLVTQNDYNLGLMNGDIGITFTFHNANKPEKTVYKVAFKSAKNANEVRWFSINRLQHIQTAYALTVHKSQGSEFEHACLVLPPTINPILTRELVYTAITRAKKYFSLVSPNPEILAQSVNQKISRDSGLLLDF